MDSDNQIDFANPSIERILKAVPMLHWRRCWYCEHVGLYRDNMLPACACEQCKSADTRPIISANKILHRGFDAIVQGVE